jgi:hypothetical protein
MSRTTKYQLEQLLAERNQQLEAARLRIAQLEGDIEALRNKQQRAASSPNTLTFVEERRRKMQLAKEAALRLGSSVKVNFG